MSKEREAVFVFEDKDMQRHPWSEFVDMCSKCARLPEYLKVPFDYEKDCETMYLPWYWDSEFPGFAYRCDKGHTWHCGWGNGESVEKATREAADALWQARKG